MTPRRILGLTIMIVAAGLFAFLGWSLFGPDVHSEAFSLMIGIPGALLAIAGTVVLFVGGEAMIESRGDKRRKQRRNNNY